MAVALSRPVEPAPRLSRPPVVGTGRLRKIGLLGSHEASLRMCPWHDPSWELWAHASAKFLYQREPDRYFDLHRKECWSKSNNKGERYLKWLARNHVPIMMQEAFPEVPASVKYPLDQIKQEFTRPYFTSHAAYMIALALTEGVTHIGFFGVNYSPDCEYGTQRGSTEFWMGVAEGRNVHLVIPDTCTLLADPQPLYGYASHDEHGVLVEAYTKRVWSREPQRRTPIGARIGADGLVEPPAWVVQESAREREECPPPPGVLGPRALEEAIA